MRSRRLLPGLILLIAGCDHREPILVKSEMDGSVITNLPGPTGSSRPGTSRFDDPNFVLPDEPTTGTVIDPFSLPSAAPPDAVAPRVPDWERLSVLSLGLDSRDGNYDFARLSTEESKRATPLQIELQAGLNALNRGQLKESLEHFESAKKADPRDFRAYFFGAIVNLQLADDAAKARAKAGFDIAISLAPQEGELYLHRGNLRLKEGDYGPAVDDFTRVLQAQPQHLGALMNRAAANFHRRRPKDIVDDTTVIIKLRPGVPDAHLLRALGYLMQGETVLGRRDFDAAVAAGLSKPAIESWKPYFRPRA
jgi:Tfp pilus assembly protein PilF